MQGLQRPLTGLDQVGEGWAADQVAQNERDGKKRDDRADPDVLACHAEQENAGRQAGDQRGHDLDVLGAAGTEPKEERAADSQHDGE